MRIRTFLGVLFAIPALAVPLFAAASGSPGLNAAFTNALTKLDREASMDAEGPMLLVDLIEKQYGTREEELKWGMAHKLSWGEISALAYIQATTGKSFAELQFVGLNHARVVEGDGPFECVFELTDISRPGIPLHGFHGVRGQSYGFAVLRREDF